MKLIFHKVVMVSNEGMNVTGRVHCRHSLNGCSITKCHRMIELEAL